MNNPSAEVNPQFQKAILEFAVEDWYGLWEIYYQVARALSRDLDETLRDELRSQLATMISLGQLEAAIWSEAKPRPLSADQMRDLSTDSDWWGSPADSDGDEQLRVAATEAGHKAYFDG